MSDQGNGDDHPAGPQASYASNPRRFMRGLGPEDLQVLSSTQKGFISTLRQLQENDTINADNLKRTIAEMFPPAVLFSQELRDLPALYTELRDFIDSRGGNMTQHSSRRVMMALATNLWEEQEDTVAATEIVREAIAAGRRRSTQSATTNIPLQAAATNSQASPSDISVERVAHNVAMRLRDNEKKFSGDLGENWMEFVDEYSQIARDYNLTTDQKLQYLP